MEIVFEDQPLRIKREGTLLEVLLDAKIQIDHSCGGHATCGSCRIIVEKDVEKLPARNPEELEFAEERGFRPEERLSCQLPCKNGFVVSRPQRFKTKNGFE